MVFALAALSSASQFSHSSQALTSNQRQAAAALSEDTLRSLVWRSVGPAHPSGRITDVAVPAREKLTVYCATATGGLWKSVNNGTTWAPIFDREGSSSIGAIAVAASDPAIVWVGTGEANASTYSSWGDGVYKSTDGGATWTNMGLRDSHHIGRIVIDPSDPNVVYVAALGHLWGPNVERGLFKTTDGGKTWTNTKNLGPDVGFVDIVMAPGNNRTLYAAAYARRSEPFDDVDSMSIVVLEGSGLYMTTDEGATWSPVTTGLPLGRLGRIGLDISPTKPNRIFAIVERAPLAVTIPAPELNNLRTLIQSDTPDEGEVARLRAIVEGATPTEERAGAVVAGLRRGEQLRARLLLGQGELDTGEGVSDDAGKTWRRTATLNQRAAYYSQIKVDPIDPEHVYVMLPRTWESTDGGQIFKQTEWAFSSWLTSNFIHGDFHALWINPQSPQHMIVGTDGGLYTSYDRGANWEAHPMPLGQFVRIAVDMRKPYFIYGGLQDNGSWAGPSATLHRSGVTDHDWFKIVTGDGAYNQVDTSDNTTVYTSSQHANVTRIDLKSGARKSIRPRGRAGEPPPRFNFIAPFVISPHDHRTLYLGGERVFKSADRGDTWQSVGGDLTQGVPSTSTGEGATISTLAESPVTPGVLFVGTDDGNLQVSRDGGKSWTNVVDRISGLPRTGNGRSRVWVSRVEPSHFDAGTAYVSFDAHRNNDFGAYIFATTDYGATWRSITGDLPRNTPVSVIREDLKNPDLLFAGTETGVFASLDRGRQWVRLANGLPTVPVDDIVVHPRDGELVIGTHGRSVYVMDISPLQQLTRAVLTSGQHLFEPTVAATFTVDVTRNKGASGARRFTGPNPYHDLIREDDSSGLSPPGATIWYYLRDPRPEPVTVTILDSQSNVVRELSTSATVGLNRVVWDLRKSPLPPAAAWRRAGGNDSVRLAATAADERPGPFVAPGMYELRVTIGNSVLTRTLRVEVPAVSESLH
jgi:photosystem II stability/assembly factor-like uncharacterized protein